MNRHVLTNLNHHQIQCRSTTMTRTPARRGRNPELPFVSTLSIEKFIAEDLILDKEGFFLPISCMVRRRLGVRKVANRLSTIAPEHIIPVHLAFALRGPVLMSLPGSEWRPSIVKQPDRRLHAWKIWDQEGFHLLVAERELALIYVDSEENWNRANDALHFVACQHYVKVGIYQVDLLQPEDPQIFFIPPPEEEEQKE